MPTLQLKSLKTLGEMFGAVEQWVKRFEMSVVNIVHFASLVKLQWLFTNPIGLLSFPCHGLVAPKYG